MTWPFKNPPQSLVFASKSIVLREQAVDFAVHDELDDSWRFYDENHREADGTALLPVLFWDIVQTDPSLARLADLPPGWQAKRIYPSCEWRLRARPEGDMFFFVFEVAPKITHPDYDSVEGASAYCWIVAESLESGEQQARQLLEGELWNIRSFEEGFQVVESSFLGDEELLGYFIQAEFEGEALVFHAHQAPQNLDLEGA